MSPRNADILDTSRLSVALTQRIHEFIGHVYLTDLHVSHVHHEFLREIRPSPVPKARARSLPPIRSSRSYLRGGSMAQNKPRRVVAADGLTYTQVITFSSDQSITPDDVRASSTRASVAGTPPARC